jgi:hypothetical protein
MGSLSIRWKDIFYDLLKAKEKWTRGQNANSANLENNNQEVTKDFKVQVAVRFRPGLRNEVRKLFWIVY